MCVSLVSQYHLYRRPSSLGPFPWAQLAKVWSSQKPFSVCLPSISGISSHPLLSFLIHFSSGFWAPFWWHTSVPNSYLQILPQTCLHFCPLGSHNWAAVQFFSQSPDRGVPTPPQAPVCQYLWDVKSSSFLCKVSQPGPHQARVGRWRTEWAQMGDYPFKDSPPPHLISQWVITQWLGVIASSFSFI